MSKINTPISFKYSIIFAMRHKPLHHFSNTLALKLSITLSIFLDCVLLLGYVYGNRIGDSIGLRLIYAFLSDVVLFYSLYSFAFKIIQLDIKKNAKFSYIILGSFAIVAVLNSIFTKGSIHLFHSSLVSTNFLIVGNIMKDLIVMLIVLLSTLLLHSIIQRQQMLLENERLTVDNIRIRYEMLKKQVDPHFLFNTLNTLDGLIGIDVNKAHEYVQNLSQVFRYTIGNKEIVHLDEELDFTESYARLMKIRYGDNLQIKYNIDDKYRNYYIIPVSLQLLVENAIKHNVVSSKHPLLITIETTPNDSIRVTNTIQPKSDVEHGEGIGLANLIERYELLFHKEVIITKTNIFCVEIPLNKQQVDHPIKNTKQK